ncbi:MULTISPECIES: RNA polymerase sigma factor [Pedobacter]|uniref:RNA polymerase sigma factor n=1 Tax=Pedobacter TaxID=84567 RepID=UPI001E2F22F3|nr:MULTISPECIES: sigma factor-like helix-turn-helix DNA-binding protein [Pedobacter]
MSEVALNISKDNLKDIRQLYDKYAGMLLGFIRGSVQDQKRSEEFLIKIISEFALETNGKAASWLELRQFARYKLIEFYPIGNAEIIIGNSTNDNLNLLDREERDVFQAVYYQGKSIAQLADLLNKNENTLRTQLKSSIDKIRKARGN